MCILIADSGSTKTDWVLLQNGEVLARAHSIGFNPYFQNREQIANAIYAQLLPPLGDFYPKIKHIYFYGAGCSNPENCAIIEQGIGSHFKNTKIEIAHDLLAAARALCGDKPGIAGILGTGSNSCLYDGKDIAENVPSVGFMWGDHGSGASIGNRFLNAYFHDACPAEIKQAFEKEGYHREEILNQVYKRSMPSKYLASLSMFISKHTSHDFIKELLITCFEEFFIYQISKYTNAQKYSVNTVGSIGFIYKDFLQIAAVNKGYQLGRVIKSPLDGLIAYHQTIGK